MTAVPGWRDLSDAERAREYSPSSCIDDIGPFLDAYEARSRAAYDLLRANGTTIHEVRYGALPLQTIDLVAPDGESATPLLVFIHGGYWQQLSKTDAFFAAPDCVANGVAFAAVDYTLAPHASLDEIVDECRRAVTALCDGAADHGIDPNRIIVTGSSAGAHLAAMVGLGDTGWRPAGLGLLSGVFELEPLIGTDINDAVGLDVEAAHRNSPLLAELHEFPPTLITYGDNETEQFKAQSTAFATAVQDSGADVDSFEVAGRNHFDIVFDLCDRTTELGRRLMDLVHRTTPTEPPR
jgi:arylformamidase